MSCRELGGCERHRELDRHRNTQLTHYQSLPAPARPARPAPPARCLPVLPGVGAVTAAAAAAAAPVSPSGTMSCCRSDDSALPHRVLEPGCRHDAKHQ